MAKSSGNWEDLFENPQTGYLARLKRAESANALRNELRSILESIFTRKSDAEKLEAYVQGLTGLIPDTASAEKLARLKRASARGLRLLKREMQANARPVASHHAPPPVHKEVGGRRAKPIPWLLPVIAGACAAGVVALLLYRAFNPNESPAQALVRQMEAMHEDRHSAASRRNDFGGLIRRVNEGGLSGVMSDRVPTDVCVGATWSLANKGTIQVNGITPSHIRIHDLDDLCRIDASGATLVWVPR